MKVCKSNKCTGCGVCVDVCPKKCVELVTDKDGFFSSSVIESLCISCGLCKKVCPANNPNNINKIQSSYKARRKNKDDTIKSTSSGVATLISEYIIKHGGFVAGCGFDENLNLKHSITKNLEQIDKFRGSKYQQSNVVGVYKEIKSMLSNGSTVVFIGTPCQSAALKNFVGKEYDGLYIVDFVCHGVPTDKILNKYIESLKMGNLIDVKYRNKDESYVSSTGYNIKVKCENGNAETSLNNGVCLWFASSLSIRKSCYDCNFSNMSRCSDITLADYFGNDLTDEEKVCGAGAIFVNTEKGKRILNAVQNDLCITEIDTLSTIKLYSRLNNKTNVPKCRKKFFKDIDKLNYDELTKKYTLKKILPNIFIRKAKAFLRRLESLFRK